MSRAEEIRTDVERVYKEMQEAEYQAYPLLNAQQRNALRVVILLAACKRWMRDGERRGIKWLRDAGVKGFAEVEFFDDTDLTEIAERRLKELEP